MLTIYTVNLLAAKVLGVTAGETFAVRHRYGRFCTIENTKRGPITSVLFSQLIPVQIERGSRVHIKSCASGAEHYGTVTHYDRDDDILGVDFGSGEPWWYTPREVIANDWEGRL